MKNHLRKLALSTLAFALVPLAQANATTITVFDSTTTAWTATNGFSTNTGSGPTTVQTNNNPAGPTTWTNAVTDYYGLGSAIQTGSGIWTLTANVQQNFGASMDQRALNLGFGNFTNASVLQSSTTANTGGPYLVDNQGPANGTGGNVSHGGSLSSGGSNGTLLNGIYRLDTPNNPTITEGAPATYQLILDTTNPAWTLQFSVNGTAMKFNKYAADGTTITNADVTTLTYGSTLPAINGIGLGAANYTGDTTVFSVQLTDTVTSAVPEPSTWAMMVLGFAGLGFLAYRRKDRKAGIDFRLV